MSMRIGNQADGAGITSTRSSAAQTIGHDTRPAASTSADNDGDQVSLSSASSLVALAKNSNPPDKQAKVAALTAQVRSGSYSVDNAQTSRALIRAISQTD